MSDATNPISLTPGAATSEGQMAKSAALWGTVIAVLASVSTFGAMALQMFHLAPDSNVAIIAGAVIAVAGILKTTIVTVTHAQSRTDLKTSQIEAQAKLAIVSLTTGDKAAA